MKFAISNTLALAVYLNKFTTEKLAASFRKQLMTNARFE